MAPRPPSALWLRFAGPWPAAAAALVESDLGTAFIRRGLAVQRAADADALPARPELTVIADNQTLDHITLVLDSAPNAPVIRRLELASFPPDGRILALVVAADELLAAVGDPERWRTPSTTGSSAAGDHPKPPDSEKPKAVVAVPAVVERTSATPANSRHRRSLGAGFAVEHFSGGQTHLGPSLMGTLNLGEDWFVGLAADGRQGRAVATSDGRVTSRLLGARAAVGAYVAGHGQPLTLSIDAGVRAGRLWFEGQAAPPTALVGNRVGTFSVVGDLRATLALHLGRHSPVSVRLGAGVGVPLLAQRAAQATTPVSTTPITSASGLVVESEAGIALHF